MKRTRLLTISPGSGGDSHYKIEASNLFIHELEFSVDDYSADVGWTCSVEFLPNYDKTVPNFIQNLKWENIDEVGGIADRRILLCQGVSHKVLINHAFLNNEFLAFKFINSVEAGMVNMSLVFDDDPTKGGEKLPEAIREEIEEKETWFTILSKYWYFFLIFGIALIGGLIILGGKIL